MQTQLNIVKPPQIAGKTVKTKAKIAVISVHAFTRSRVHGAYEFTLLCERQRENCKSKKRNFVPFHFAQQQVHAVARTPTVKRKKRRKNTHTHTHNLRFYVFTFLYAFERPRVRVYADANGKTVNAKNDAFTLLITHTYAATNSRFWADADDKTATKIHK